MPARSSVMIAMLLVPLATGARAGSLLVPPPGSEPAAGAYLEVPPAVPPDGCVWENTVFSSGAIIQGREHPRVFFRCVQGSWRSYDSFDDARAGRERVPEIVESGDRHR